MQNRRNKRPAPTFRRFIGVKSVFVRFSSIRLRLSGGGLWRFCSILFLAFIGGVVYVCIGASSSRKSNVYSVDSIIIPEDKTEEGKEELKLQLRETGGEDGDADQRKSKPLLTMSMTFKINLL